MVCYAVIEAHINRVKAPISNQTNQGSGDKIAWAVDTLSQHAVAQSQTGETSHAISTCYMQPSYPSMQSANQRPGKSDMLFQHRRKPNTDWES